MRNFNQVKKIGKIFASTIVLFILFFPAFSFIYAQAQQPTAVSDTDYITLAPLPNTTDCADADLSPPTADSPGGCQTNLSTYVQGAFNLIVGLAAVLAFVMLTYGGVLYMTSDAVFKKSEGKKYVNNALIGLLLVIASYVILYTINPSIVSFNLQMTQPNTTAGIPTPGQPMTQAQIDANALMAQQLGQTSNPCAQGQTTNCVNLVGLQQNTVTGIQQLKATCASVNSDACPNFVITAGSIDPGDTTHDPNGCHPKGTCVDVSPTPDLNNTIWNDKKDFTFVSKNTDGSCARYTDSSGNIYLYETANVSCGGSVASSGNHWHITFK